MRLEMGMETRLQLQQKLVLAPQIIQSIEILQLPSVSLPEYIDQALVENEALEVDVADAPPPQTPAVKETSVEEEGVVDGVTPQEYVPEEWDELRSRRPRGEEERDRKYEALQNTANRPQTLQDRLAEQFTLVEAPPRVLDVARALVYNLDDRGYLPPHRFVQPLLDAMDESGSLTRPLADGVADTDGVAAVKVPEARRGVTPEQVAEAQDARERHVLEAQGVLSRIQRIRTTAAGSLGKHDILLRYPLVEMIEREGGDWTVEEAEQALRIVQALEPRGVGGRTLEETLVLQLDPEDLLFEEKRTLLSEHLDDLKKNRLQKIAREMNLSIEDVQILLEELHDHVSLTPGAMLSPGSARAVHPDVLIREEEGEFKIDLVNSYLPPLTVRSDFVALMNDKNAPQAMRDVARRRVESARWLIDAIQQRQATLTRVAERIFHHQRGFLERGESALRPLKMQTVADALGIHVSTVSRAIADKWVETPHGIKPLKFFFTGGTENSSGEVESRHNVKNRVKEIIDAEDPANPLSDDDVAARLKDLGLEVARRTVTKYRKQLSIPSSRQRRVWSSSDDNGRNGNP